MQNERSLIAGSERQRAKRDGMQSETPACRCPFLGRFPSGRFYTKKDICLEHTAGQCWPARRNYDTVNCSFVECGRANAEPTNTIDIGNPEHSNFGDGESDGNEGHCQTLMVSTFPDTASVHVYIDPQEEHHFIRDGACVRTVGSVMLSKVSVRVRVGWLTNFLENDWNSSFHLQS